MKIHKIQIGAFGKLKDVTMEFADGFQIIEKKNESGKSTVMAFLQMMFYGKASTSRDIRQNPRKRFEPWDGSKMHGAVEFSYGGIPYRLEKNFAKSAGSDKVVLLNMDSGEPVALAKDEEVGMHFFQMDRNGFEKSIFIGTLGSFSGDGDKDSIAEKLSNLSETADEDVSAELVMKHLREAKEELVSKSGRTGSLIRIREEKEALLEKLRQVMEFERSLEGERSRYHQLEEERNLLINKLNLIKCQIRMQKLDQYIEAGHEFQKQKEAFARLSVPFEKLDEYFEECKNNDIRLEQTQQRLERLQKEFSLETIDSLERLEQELTKQESLLSQVRSQKAQEQGTAQELQRAWKDRSNACQEMEAQEQNLKAESDNRQKQWEGIEEARLQEQKNELQRRMAEHTLLPKKTGKQKKKLGFLILLCFVCAVGLLLAGVGMLVVVRVVVPAVVVLTAAVILFFIGIQIRRKDGRRQEVKEKKITESIDELQKALNGVNEKLRWLLDEKSEQSALMARRSTLQEQLGRERKQRDEIKGRLEEVNERLKAFDLQMQNIQDQIEGICNRGGAQMAGELHEICVDSRAKKEQLRQMKEEEKELTESLRQLLPDMSKDSTAEECIGQYRKWNQMYERLKEQKHKLDMLKKAYGFLNQSMEAYVEEQIDLYKRIEQIIEKDDIINTITKIDDIPQLEHQQEELQRQLNNKEEVLRKAGEQLKPSDYNPLTLERRLYELEESEQEQSRYYTAVSAADSVMEDTVRQLRQSFGSDLNEKTGQILQRLTKGRYQQAIVSKDYGIQVQNEEDLHYRDWKYLSSGTVDQMYLALRLAITQCITQDGERLPLFLDDILAQYDEDRVKETLQFLQEYAKGGQIILFTCHNYRN